MPNKIHDILVEAGLIEKVGLHCLPTQKSFAMNFYHRALADKSHSRTLTPLEKSAAATVVFTHNMENTETFATGDMVFLAWKDVKRLVDPKKTLDEIVDSFALFITADHFQKSLEDVLSVNYSLKDMLQEHQGKKQERLNYLQNGTVFKKKTYFDEYVWFLEKENRGIFHDIVSKGSATTEKDKETLVNVFSKTKNQEEFAWPLCYSFAKELVDENKIIPSQQKKMDFASTLQSSAGLDGQGLEYLVDVLSGSSLWRASYSDSEDLAASLHEAEGNLPSAHWLQKYEEEIRAANPEIKNRIKNVLTWSDIENSRDFQIMFELYPEEALNFVDNVKINTQEVTSCLGSFLVSDTECSKERKEKVKKTVQTMFTRDPSQALLGALFVSEYSKFSSDKKYIDFFKEIVSPEATRKKERRTIFESFSKKGVLVGEYRPILQALLKKIKKDEEREAIFSLGLQSPSENIREFFAAEKSSYQKKFLNKNIKTPAPPPVVKRKF